MLYVHEQAADELLLRHDYNYDKSFTPFYFTHVVLDFVAAKMYISKCTAVLWLNVLSVTLTQD